MFKMNFRNCLPWKQVLLRGGFKHNVIKHRLMQKSSASVLPKETASTIYKVGDFIHGYALRRMEDVPELSLTAYYLEHIKTGAQHLHISRDDMNNAFAVSFRTTPVDDTGVAHILEHTTLCGSKNFPVRDPFFNMLNRSLATYMNAHTGSDYTMYPFSTQNQKDYENLMRVYLDAVFFPLLNEADFRQEGWRLENEVPDDKSSPLIFKGIVFNEMKGVFSDASQIYLRHLLKNLFPSTTYSNESGGDPLKIPDLSHEQLLNFYRQYYHPSNSKFFTYGNFSLEANLALINDLALSKFENMSHYRVQSLVKDQPLWDSPKHVEITCPVDKLAPFPDRQTTASISFLLGNITNPYELFTLSILTHLLLHGHNSPFYESLLASGIGMDFSPGYGLIDFTKQSLCSIGLQGIAETDVQKVYDIILATLESVVEEGFPQERIDAVLHLIELSLKHQTRNFGVNLICNLNPAWNHDADPIQILQINKHMNMLRKDLQRNPRFLQEKIKSHFLDNQHRLHLVMKPSQDYDKVRNHNEQNLLQEKTSSLNDSQKEQIYQAGLDLLKSQNTKGDPSVLPTLNVYKDISRELVTTNLEHVVVDNINVQLSPQPTNEVIYFRALVRLNENDLPENLRPYLPLFCQLVTKLGAGDRNHKEMDHEINMTTGGLSCSTHVADSPTLSGDYEQGVLFSSYCLERNFEHMLSLWSDIFNSVKFEEDKDHLFQLIKISSSECSQSIAHNGHRFAMTRAASSLCTSSKLRELHGGLEFVSNLKSTAESGDVDDIIDKLRQIAKFVLQKNSMKCAINSEPSRIRSSLNACEKFVNRLPIGDLQMRSSHSKASKHLITPTNFCEHHVMPFSCNYIGKAQMCVPYTHEAFAKLRIASKLLSAKYFHREIREIGNAYGGGTSLTGGGVFLYYSYRDPNVTKTLRTFRTGLDWILDANNYSNQDVNEAKLGVFQDVDKPVTPGDQGMRQFISGITDQMFHEHRLRLLGVTREDVIEAVKHYLVSDFNVGGVVVIGPENSELKADQKWKIVMQDL